MKRAFVLISLGVLLLGALSSQSRDPVQVELKVNPTNYSGSCPVVVKMTAKITLSVAARFSARFIASNGRGSTPQTLIFGAPGSQEITESFSFNGNFSGWIAVELAPSSPAGGLSQNFVSEKVNVTLTCQPPPSIRGVSFSCEVTPGHQLDLRGVNFGSVQGTRKVLIEGNPAEEYYAWNGENILCKSTLIFFDPDRNYEFVIVDAGGNPLSNVFTKNFKMCWLHVIPSQAQVGATVDLAVWVKNINWAACVVKLGNVDMPWQLMSSVASFTNIRVTVPQVAPGTYNIGIFKSGVNIMRDRSFTVLP